MSIVYVQPKKSGVYMKPLIRLDTEELLRFQSSYYRGSIDECWEWQKCCFNNGYGCFSARNKNWVATRLTYYNLIDCNFDQTLSVLHKCDNRKCQNPTHLFLGTISDNTRDKIAKERDPNRKGENNPRSKLTNAQCKVIEQLYLAGGHTYKSLGLIYSVDPTIIRDIVKHYRNF